MDFKNLGLPDSNYIVRWNDFKGFKYLGFCQLTNARKHVKCLLNCCVVSDIIILKKSDLSLLGNYGS